MFKWYRKWRDDRREAERETLERIREAYLIKHPEFRQYEHRIYLPIDQFQEQGRRNELHEWLKATGDKWGYRNAMHNPLQLVEISFANKNDALLCKLTWGGSNA